MQSAQASERGESSFPVAVVGLSGRFPGAADPHAFWQNLSRRFDPVTKVPKDRWDWRDHYGEPDDGSPRSLANAGAFAPLVDRFDAAFFDILPREAQSMDPQQRLFLQASFAALEDAGIAPRSLAGRSVSVFAGVGFPDYPQEMRLAGAPYDAFRGTGVTPTAVANRVSFALDVRGPSETIDTACSGSLIAVHRAIQSLRLGESEMAIAGGVNLLLGPELFVAFGQAGMLSPTGECRTFDAGANGYVRGEGVGAVVLRPLNEAEADGDFIYGVIRGSATNHGGKAHSFTAPNIAAQSDLVRTAWDKAGLDLNDAVLLETHGTGTPLGDPIEVQALKRALGPQKDEREKRTALGALKTQIGHLEGAAGVAGLIKVLLALTHRQIPANLHFETLNPKIDLAGTPFFVADEPVPLTTDPGAKLTAGVSSFGFGGANAHVVVASFPYTTCESREAPARPYLIPLSARTKQALVGRARQLLAYLSVGEGDAGSQALPLDELTLALGLGRLPAGAGDVPLRVLRVDVGDLGAALRRIGVEHDVSLGLEVIRDCVTLSELAEQIGAAVQGRIGAGSADELLLSKVAIPESAIRGASLAQISFTLTHGRDALGERLAIIASTKEELKERLQQYLADPDAKSDAIFIGSVRRPAENPSEAPETGEVEAADAEQLRAWARHWTSVRAAKLDWSGLHGQHAPRKVPLPSYPFALTRHWFESRREEATETAEPRQMQQERVGRAQFAPRRAAQPSPAEPEAAAPLISPEAFARSFPSSAVALAYLLDDLAVRSLGETVRLEGLVFGPPRTVDLSKLQCVRVSSDGGDTAQCLDMVGAPKVLLQAGLAADLSPPRFDSGKATPGDPNDLRQAWHRLSPSRELPAAIAYVGMFGENCLHARLDPAASTDRSAPFWSTVFATLFSAWPLLGEAGSATAMPALYRAEAAGFEPRRKEALGAILVRRGGGGAIDLLAQDKAGIPLFWLDGLQLRQTSRPTVSQQIREEALAS